MSIVACSGVIALLHALSSAVRNDRSVHDVLVEAAELRAGYTARLKQIAIDTGVEVPSDVADPSDFDEFADVEIISD